MLMESNTARPTKYYTENFESYSIDKTISLRGNSRAGYNTSFIIQPYGFVLDFGSFTHKLVNLGFITHHHSDHCQKFPQIMTSLYKI
jgi:hypothetical protein